MKKYHLCCGPQLWGNGWTNVDIGHFGQEIEADLSKPWTFCPDGTADYIICKDGFEHMPSAEHFLKEASRILKKGGILEIWVPHFKNPSAYRLTHLRLCSWSYFDIFPEAHDETRTLKVVENKIYVGNEKSWLWATFHAFINLFPKWWERLFYTSNISVKMQRI
jgi:predicted SAM-dependent methyltransferase